MAGELGHLADGEAGALAAAHTEDRPAARGTDGAREWAVTRGAIRPPHWDQRENRWIRGPSSLAPIWHPEGC